MKVGSHSPFDRNNRWLSRTLLPGAFKVTSSLPLQQKENNGYLLLFSTPGALLGR